MIFVFVNPDVLPLEAVAQALDGSARLDVADGTVRVYGVGPGGEVEVLPWTPLVQVVGTERWRYAWSTPPLTHPGMLTAEYRLVDDGGLVGTAMEDILVVDESKLDTIIDAAIGRQTLDAINNTWTIYRRDGTVLRVFDVKNDLGNPSVEDIFDRQPR
jgi:hypothetical protein